jgi:hypothetical protein
MDASEASGQSLLSSNFVSILEFANSIFRAIALIAAKMDGVPSERTFIFFTLNNPYAIIE